VVDGYGERTTGENGKNQESAAAATFHKASHPDRNTIFQNEPVMS